MAPLSVDGDTLGQKHQNYNKIVNEAIKNNPTPQITALNYEESDLDNLYKIDIACNRRNVEYILEVLKSEDMLYVSRAIKQSTWLITDQQYASIINPEYLYNSLSPQMTTKAFNKLVLHIRLNLEDENRVEAFFNYSKKEDLQKAFKWLPGCSNLFIEDIIQKHADDIPERIFKRLYEKSITFVKLTLRSLKLQYLRRDKISPAVFLVKRNVEMFLDIIEVSDVDCLPRFSPKITKKVMESSPERIMKNLEKYVSVLDISTFAKFIKNEEAKDFILSHIQNKKMRFWFIHKNLKHFLNRLPSEERFDFIKKYFIEKFHHDNVEAETWRDVVVQCSPPFRGKESSLKNIYSWYIYAPFDRAFEELKQLIRKESSPSDRILVFSVMLTCAGSDKQSVCKLLKYYREHHINEPFKYKIQFVNKLLTKTDTHRYDNETWGYLNDLFNSMEVYSKSDKNVQLCVKAIISHHVVNGKNIPEIIENKYEFENLDGKIKFNVEEREKIFDFLYNYLILKMKNDFNTDKEFDETVDYVVKVLNLLKDWNKELKDYPCILQKIKDLINAKKKKSWNRDLSEIYNVQKSWRKLLLAESILLNPTEDSCINALKHSPKLFEIYRDEIKQLWIYKNNHIERFLKKIRIYWYQSLAESFKTTFLENVEERSIQSHVALIKGICTLLPPKELLDFIKKYVPKESKIDWSQPDELELNLWKGIGKGMHLARPHPPLAVVLLYAKGDYLQYVLPSLNAILHNISANNIAENLPKLINSPVALQQHSIQAAFSKLKHEKLQGIFSDIWKSSTNSTIRTVIFCHTYKMLSTETNESDIKEIWDLLSIFIENLTFNENKKIYLTLSKVEKVPLSVRTEFWMKSYDFLKKLPASANCTSLINDLCSQMNDIMETLDVGFMAKICFENFDIKFTTVQYDYSYQVSLYLLSTKTEAAQMERYEKILLPILEKAIAGWDKQHKNVYHARNNLSDIFASISREFENVVLKKQMIFPISMYTSALNKLQNNLPTIESYMLLTNIKLSLGYIQILHDQKANTGSAESFDINRDVGKDLRSSAAPIFGSLCLKYLKEDVANHFPSIYVIFAETLDAIFKQFSISFNDKLAVIKGFLEDKDFIQGYLVVMKLIPSYSYGDEENALKNELLEALSFHPLEEVLMHYWLLRRDN
ncbi:uncharacterized protein LOC120628359 [Pararge aegeria]|uniref:uncharacterized protein LOC120628359 n=1 Tax=Pararge aegeria TaxID=116150 RepID=UPI0019D24FE5|nr:uncharacterized protein LOC120628359 [Pararge aegeria]XP_039752622.1 uncharacterized protein LOC120628359 [Pararge aegeria]